MRTNVNFEARVAIGLGAAVLDIKEWCDPDWCVEPGTILECVKDDISADGTESWLDLLGVDVPHEAGIYKVKGAALFTEDESIYQCVTFEGV